MKKMIKFNGNLTAYTIDEIIDYLLEHGIDVRSFAMTEFQQKDSSGTILMVPTKGIIMVVYNDEDVALNNFFYHAKYLAGEGLKP